MNALDPHVAWYGRAAAPPTIVKLRAGETAVEFEDGDLRYIAQRGTEYVRRVYMAVRDVNWRTIPAQISNLATDIQADHFHITYDARHVDGELHYRWRAEITGYTDGRIEYAMHGEAESDFRYCRIGFCVLHPIVGIAGQPYRAQTPAGEIHGTLPELVAPQEMENGFEKPIFPSCSSLTVTAADGAQVTTAFEGDLFEMEDQRNWTDGSFKTYCTPLALGYPHHAKRGQRFEQRVTVRVELPHGVPRAAPVREGPLEVRVRQTTQTLPHIGFGIPNDGHTHDAREVGLLRRLQPDHLKVEVHGQDAGWAGALDNAIALARAVECGLEVAFFLPDQPDAMLHDLSTRLQDAPIARAIIFNEQEAPNGTTSPRWLELARAALSRALPGVPLLGGTNGNFAELNRQRPPVQHATVQDPTGRHTTAAAMDGVAYRLNPQVHAADERSLVEAIQAQRDTVITARSFCGTLPICISSVTLKPPFNQAATEEVAPAPEGMLPENVDPRQMSLFAAGWTVGSVRSLAAGGAHAITYYETSGWRGLMTGAAGSPLPDQFPALPEMIFPLYYVFAMLAAGKRAPLVEITAATSIFVEGVGFVAADGLHLALTNLQPQPQRVTLGPLPGSSITLARLNAATMPLATRAPDAFLAQAETVPLHAGAAELTLVEYETLFVQAAG